MDKQWFIYVDGKQEGPYNFQDLKLHSRITPDTLIWKKGFDKWVPIRSVPELQDLFKDDPESQSLQDLLSPKLPPNLKQEQDVLALRQDPSQFLLWVLLLILILIYTLYQAYQ